ncbi:hypothetical protein BD324DRAFT_619177 [Kockovaella imperatae]|uniref:Class E vacuolar protein-sorting machinery protein HSE1 n=1 Tax=Kockovaella imperatae TaxID=4999 RepID=A0A1Y1UQ76_9TREE|nr:hypothetical protein BD324DRAFT_619177 [Kockovaella imperatae]ORX39295.1 hypothetical protein BD324DRAFT_619177 [Kockovaella imperatae]
MFSTATNPYDDLITKATNENLASEDWALNMEVCDKVSGDGSTGARNAVGALTKRLTHRNPSVQLYALELANTLAQNCGKPLMEEMSSRNWTGALDRLVNDRTTAKPVQKKALGYIKSWAKQFEDTGDRNVGMMGELYDQLRRKDLQFDEPEPTPESPEEARRRQEDEELKRVLELSKQDKGGRSSSSAAPAAGSGSSSSSARPNGNAYASTSRVESSPPRRIESELPPIPDLETATRVRALYTFTSNEIGELNFERGDVIKVLDRGFKEWWRGACNGKIGIFPTTYVEAVAEPSAKELQDEARDEARVFASLGLVDQLLQTLKSVDPARGDRIDNRPDIEEMYQASVALQGQINTLIKKYSDQKAELEHMNANFVRAMRQYEELRNGSQPAQPQYGYHPPAGYPQQPQTNQYAQNPAQSAIPNPWQQSQPGPHSYESAPDPRVYPAEAQQYQQQPPPQEYQQSHIPMPMPTGVSGVGADVSRQSSYTSPTRETGPQYGAAHQPAPGSAPPQNGQPGQPFYHQYSASNSSLHRAPTGAPDLPPTSPQRQPTQTRPGAAGVGSGIAASGGTEAENKAAWDAYYAQQAQQQNYGQQSHQPGYQGYPVGQGHPGGHEGQQGAGNRASSYGGPGLQAGGVDRVTSGMNRMSVHGQ